MNMKAILATCFLFFACAQAINLLDPVIKEAAIRGAKFSIENITYNLEALQHDPHQAMLDLIEEKIENLPPQIDQRICAIFEEETDFYRGLSGQELEIEAKHVQTQLELILQVYRKALENMTADQYDVDQVTFFIGQNDYRELKYTWATSTLYIILDGCERLISNLKENLPAAQEMLKTWDIRLGGQTLDGAPISQEVIDGVLEGDEDSAHQLCSTLESYQGLLEDLIHLVAVEESVDRAKLTQVLKLAKIYQVKRSIGDYQNPAHKMLLADLNEWHRFKPEGKELLLRIINQSIAMLDPILNEFSNADVEDVKEVLARLQPERILAAFKPSFKEMIDAFALRDPIMSTRKASLVKNQYILILTACRNLLIELKQLFERPEFNLTNKATLTVILYPWNILNPEEEVKLSDILEI